MTTKAKTKNEVQNKEKNDSIEQTVAKSNVRTDLTEQAEEAVTYYEGTANPILLWVYAGLPAVNAFFEHAFTNAFKKLNGAIEIVANCVDRDRKVAVKALYNIPENAAMLHGEFSDLFTKTLVRKDNVLYATGEQKVHNKYNFVWADYCCPANAKLMDDAVSVIDNSIDRGLFYVTFCGSTRIKGGRTAMLKKIGKARTAKDVTPDEVAEELIKQILKRTSKNVKLVYNVIYGGGQSGKTTMITLGFSVNMAKGAVTPIVENRQVRDAKRYTTCYKLKNTKGWKLPVRKKHKRKAGKPSAEVIKTQMEKVALRKKVTIRANKGWTSEEIALDINKAHGYKLTTGQVGAMRAWMNKDGKLASKRVKAKK